MMQHWDAAATMQATTTVNYEQHNNWYNSMFAANIKTELDAASPPGGGHRSDATTPPTAVPAPANGIIGGAGMSQLESYLKQQHHHHQQQQQHQSHHSHQSAMDTLATAMTPSPSNNNDSMQHFFDSNMQQQLLQQQQYQQQFQQAQHAAAQNPTAAAASTHLPLGFNPLTPPGLPNAVMPSMAHFYGAAAASGALRGGGQQTPSPQPSAGALAHTPLATPSDGSEKLQSALTPRNTPPMDITPPKSPKVAPPLKADTIAMGGGRMSVASNDKEQDLVSNSSEDLKYMVESEDDETIRQPIYNSHGKMKNYRCKTCGHVAFTKVAFWEHTREHMKPEKLLQCPKCPFVTELKHHLEYHIRKHKNLKPFQCDKCSYTCVNKSMLNSHRKSHSSVYQYRCADCDYATKYCHSFKLHLRKYEHKPGMVLDEEGLPNPAVIIDVYGTRRGPKNKSGGSGSGGGGSKRSERLTASAISQQQKPLPPTSQLSAALQGFSLPAAQQQQQSQSQALTQHQMPASPAKSNSSANSELPTATATALTINMALQQQAQQHQRQQQQQQQQQQVKSDVAKVIAATAAANAPTAVAQAPNAPPTMSNLLPPLASILQQNHNHMAFFPYWNLNLQMLAAQQQVAALAQLSPSMRETALQQLQQQQQQQHDAQAHYDDEDDEEAGDCDGDGEGDDELESDRRSIDSAMDLSQGTPTKDEQPVQQTPPEEAAMNLMLKDNAQHDTPLIVSQSSSRRKGRVLKLDTLLQVKSDLQSPAVAKVLQPNAASSPISKMDTGRGVGGDDSAELDAVVHEVDGPETEEDEDECMRSSAGNATSAAGHGDATVAAATASNNSSSGNSSNSSNSSNASASGSGHTNQTSTSNAASPPAGAIYECKYCDIYFKDAVLYHIHMGYHSCDDVFRCNMCGEKCDSPVGLFVHMARNAHS